MQKTKTGRPAKLAEGLDQCLVIPEGLAGFDDAQLVMQDGSAGIYHKLIKADALGVEFFSTVPCLCFVMRGKEAFLTPDGEEIAVNAGEMILLPGNLPMISNFTSAAGPLEAFLFFFDQKVNFEFERCSEGLAPRSTKRVGAYKIAAREELPAYMQSLGAVYKHLRGSRELLRAKLMELLHLVSALDEPKRLASFLKENSPDVRKRNIRHLMRKHQAHNLSVADYAMLSGRSVSSFNREFKRQFDMPPSRYLAEQRLKRARDAVLETDASVTDIGLDAGYQNTSHFIAQFKSRFGVTPKRLRMSHL
jgi:AraC family transcriptional regulator, exoenzyme S synthesis regulatory protein ExsA